MPCKTIGRKGATVVCLCICGRHIQAWCQPSPCISFRFYILQRNGNSITCAFVSMSDRLLTSHIAQAIKFSRHSRNARWIKRFNFLQKITLLGTENQYPLATFLPLCNQIEQITAFVLYDIWRINCSISGRTYVKRCRSKVGSKKNTLYIFYIHIKWAELNDVQLWIKKQWNMEF